MRSLVTLFCSIALIFAWDGGDRLLWAAPSTDFSAVGSVPPSPPESMSTPTGQVNGECQIPPPLPDWVCVNGGWVLPPGGRYRHRRWNRRCR